MKMRCFKSNQPGKNKNHAKMFYDFDVAVSHIFSQLYKGTVGIFQLFGRPPPPPKKKVGKFRYFFLLNKVH